MKTLAVIGLGNISNRHRRNLKALYPDAQVLAMSASGRPITSLPQCADAMVSNVDELVAARPDLVIIASPAPMHHYHAQVLLKAGVACIVEKPLCADSTQAKELMDALIGVKTPVAVGYCLRYMPSAIKMKELVYSGGLGEIYSIHIEVGQYLPDWRPDTDFRQTVSARKELGGGALLELSHELDYANWLFGPLTPLQATIKHSKTLKLEVEDLVDVGFASQSGAHLHMHLDFLQRQPSRFCTVHCSAGKVHWNLLLNRIDWTDESGLIHVFDYPDWQANDMYMAMVRDMQNNIDAQPNQCVSLSQAAEVLDLIDTIRKMQS
ncbi:Gfo/Idh/MocA family protein [Pseudoalteromonas sp. SSDWG2]|uniref:Gfo/Idh/MocA family protein n=1 Tax=Pseudoalteromonas sp. SSDWG2 TaxID=3139391 RepID=UPI003BAB888B